MEVTQEIVLPVLLAAIVANAVILVLVVVATRVGRRDRMSSTRSALQGSLLSSSFVDQPSRSAWRTQGEPNGDSNGDSNGHSSGESKPDPSARRDAGETTADGDPVEVEPRAAVEPDDPSAAEPTQPGASSGVDPLTGLLDQSTFTRVIIAEDVRIHRYHRPATVVIFEVDGLDRLVDRLGPDAADRIIPALADTMRRLARGVDHVARLGPGRFGVLLPETDEVAAINYVERVRRSCELWLESGAIALGLAAGWASTTGDPTLLDASRMATERMFVELRREARRADR
jgi:diguanylate cyclase (GGDEF)-like protein